MKKISLSIFTILLSLCVNAQGLKPVPYVGSSDSIPSYLLEEANITVVDIEFQKRYDNSKYYALKMYNYAMLASAMLNEFEDSLSTMDSKRDQNKYLKEVNHYLKDEFGDEIGDLSVNSGKYLMKIIHKETGLTAYEIIKKYNGGLKAMWWQGVVKVFGATIKHEYDPLGEDDGLAKVLMEIESGKLTPRPRPIKTQAAKDSMSRKEKKALEKQEKKKAKENKKKGDLVTRSN
jgi:hypothetical protein